MMYFKQEFLFKIVLNKRIKKTIKFYHNLFFEIYILFVDYGLYNHGKDYNIKTMLLYNLFIDIFEANHRYKFKKYFL